MANPSLYDPSMIVSGLIGVALTEMVQAAKDATVRQDIIKRFRHRYKLDNDEKIQSFDAFYGLALIEFGVGRERVAFEIFKNPYVREAFEHFFRTRDDEQLRKEVDEIVSLKEEVGATQGKEYDYRRDIEPFKQTFFALLKRYRSPQFVALHHHLDDIQQGISELKEYQQHQQHQQGPVVKSNEQSSSSVAPLRWLHLSDFHVGEKKDEKTQLFQQILDDIQAHNNAGKGPDLIFITGDIVGLTLEEKEVLSRLDTLDDEESAAFAASLTNSLRSRYETFADQFLFPLIERIGIGEDKIFMVPGDQDIHPLEGTLLKKHGLLKDDRRFLKATAKGKELRQQYCSRFQMYIANNGLEIQQDHWLSSKEGVRVEKKTIKGLHIGVMLTNTAWLAEGVKGRSDEERKRDLGQLSPGKEMIREGLRQLKQCDVRFVLGHHPVEWFVEEDGCRERSGIRTLFKEDHVLYLHGHLIKSAEDPIEANFFYQPMAAGASFITNSKDLWRTRILWCELEPETRSQITVEPLLWERDSSNAKVDRSAIPSSLKDQPALQTFRISRHLEDETEETKGVPTGWKSVTLSYLDKYRESTPDDMLHYFDGRRPVWKEILAPHIKPRKQVDELIKRLEQIRDNGDVKVTAFIGPSGEGKSTIVQQVVRTLVESQDGWHVWWREDDRASLSFNDVSSILYKDGPYLIVADDAESVVKDVFEVAKRLIKEGRRNIQFLLCCRSIDWEVAEENAEKKLPMKPAFVHKLTVAPLIETDAKLIIEAWKEHKGLGKNLQEMLFENAVAFLMTCAQEESVKSSEEGALLGAMLDVRYSPDGLRLRIHDLLLRLNQIAVVGKMTLLDAFAYIAAAHVQHLPLPYEVLADVFRLEPERGIDPVKFKIVGRLCDEAVTTTTSRFVFIRHRKIADAVMRILAEDTHLAVSERQLYVDLLKATRNVFNGKTFSFSSDDATRNSWIQSWNSLPDTIAHPDAKGARGDLTLAIELTKALIEVEYTNLYFKVKLSQLRRERKAADDEQEGQKMFIEVLRKAADEANRNNVRARSDRDALYHYLISDRAFFYEWATFSGTYKQDGIDAWLAGLSLADELVLNEPVPLLNRNKKPILDKERIRESLVGLGIVFMRMCASSSDSVFTRAYKGVTFLVFQYFSLSKEERLNLRPDQKMSESLRTSSVEVTNVSDAVIALASGVRLAYENLSEDETREWMGSGEDLLARGDELKFELLKSWFTNQSPHVG